MQTGNGHFAGRHVRSNQPWLRNELPRGSPDTLLLRLLLQPRKPRNRQATARQPPGSRQSYSDTWHICYLMPKNAILKWNADVKRRNANWKRHDAEEDERRYKEARRLANSQRTKLARRLYSNSSTPAIFTSTLVSSKPMPLYRRRI